MEDQLKAQVKCLEYKLNSIKTYCEDHLSMNPENIELEGVLTLIHRFERVPDNFKLDEPLVKIEEE